MSAFDRRLVRILDQWLNEELHDEALDAARSAGNAEELARLAGILAEATSCPFNETDADPEWMEQAARAIILDRATRLWIADASLTAADLNRRARSVMLEVRKKPWLWRGGTENRPYTEVSASASSNPESTVTLDDFRDLRQDSDSYAGVSTTAEK